MPRKRRPADDKPRGLVAVDLGVSGREHTRRVLAERGETLSAAVRRLLREDGLLPPDGDHGEASAA